MIGMLSMSSSGEGTALTLAGLDRQCLGPLSKFALKRACMHESFTDHAPGLQELVKRCAGLGVRSFACLSTV